MLGVRETGCGLAFVAGAILVMTSGIFTAMAQPVEDLDEPPETVQRTGRSTEANLKTRAEIKSSSAAERRVPCDQVISQVDRESYTHPRHAVEMSVVAKNLDTNVVWVERCMVAYGRQPRRPSAQSVESKEKRLESLEEDEPEERAPEEIEEAGARYQRELREKRLREGSQATSPGEGEEPNASYLRALRQQQERELRQQQLREGIRATPGVE